MSSRRATQRVLLWVVCGALLALVARQPVWDSAAGLLLAIVLAYALFLAVLALFSSGRALLRRAGGFAGRMRRRG